MITRLFEPLTINGCDIPNRLAVPAMVTSYSNDDGTVSERYISYLETRARGGWGLIITEDYAISEHAANYRGTPGLWKDGQIAGNRELTDRVHAHGAKIFCQIFHAGRQNNSGVIGSQPIAPSPIPCPWNREIPREVTIDELEQIVQDFGTAARRAKESGFDGVEIHAGHGYLLAEFLSTWANKRTDRYGGSLTNRMRLVHEVYDSIRAEVGADFPVILRYSMIEDVPGGRTMAEARVLATEFESWGVDALNLSAGVYAEFSRGVISTMFVDQAWLADMAAEIRSLVSVPTFTVNRITDPLVAVSLLVAGKADMIAMGRQSIADPDFPRKARAGLFNEINPCIACLQGCAGGAGTVNGMTCLVNPHVGQESTVDLTPDPEPKLVFVAGGGPGGMEAARTAARKGHRVELFESRPYLGGQFVSAAYPPHKGGLAHYIGWSVESLERLGVTVHLGTTLSKEWIATSRPDVLFIATGGSPTRPPIPGIEHAVPVEDALLGTALVGDRAVIIGGGECGVQTALHLAGQSREAIVVEMQDHLLGDVDLINRWQQLRLMREFQVPVHLKHRVIDVRPDGITAIDEHGQHVEIAADTVLLAAGYTPLRNLEDIARDLVPDVRVVGAASKTSNAMVAIREGFDQGLQLAG